MTIEIILWSIFTEVMLPSWDSNMGPLGLQSDQDQLNYGAERNRNVSLGPIVQLVLARHDLNNIDCAIKLQIEQTKCA